MLQPLRYGSIPREQFPRNFLVASVAMKLTTSSYNKLPTCQRLVSEEVGDKLATSYGLAAGKLRGNCSRGLVAFTDRVRLLFLPLYLSNFSFVLMGQLRRRHSIGDTT